MTTLEKIQAEIDRQDLTDPIGNAIAEGLIMAKRIVEGNGWRKLDEHPIPPYTDVLILFENKEVCRLWEENLPPEIDTHWQPLPSPPKTEQ